MNFYVTEITPDIHHLPALGSIEYVYDRERKIVIINIDGEEVKCLKGDEAKKVQAFITGMDETICDDDVTVLGLMAFSAFKLTIADLRIRTRKREIVEARQVCMWWLKNNTKQSLNDIGSYFGEFDHATVLHACKTVNNLIDTNKAFKQKIEPFIQQS